MQEKIQKFKNRTLRGKKSWVYSGHMLLTQLPATPDIWFVPPPEELPELEEELLEELELHISQFYIAVVVCFCHCCSTTVTLQQLWC
jgi:hypothetical protein